MAKRSGQAMSLVAVAVAGLCNTATVRAANSQFWQPPQSAPQAVKYLIQEWFVENDLCRGYSGEDAEMACQLRERTSLRIEALGWCYGEYAPGADAKWAVCMHRPKRAG